MFPVAFPYTNNEVPKEEVKKSNAMYNSMKMSMNKFNQEHET